MIEGIRFAQFATGGDIQTLIQSEFFAFALPFLFAFAVVYGLLSNVGEKGIPKDKHPRVILGLIAGFLVLPAGPQIVGILSQLSSSLVIAIGAFLLLIVLFELMGIKSVKHTTDTEGAEAVQVDNPFQVHYRLFLLLIAVVVILIFANSGGLAALGLPTPQFFFNSPLVFFLIFIVAIVLWVSSQEN